MMKQFSTSLQRANQNLCEKTVKSAARKSVAQISAALHILVVDLKNWRKDWLMPKEGEVIKMNLVLGAADTFKQCAEVEDNWRVRTPGSEPCVLSRLNSEASYLRILRRNSSHHEREGAGKAHCAGPV